MWSRTDRRSLTPLVRPSAAIVGLRGRCAPPVTLVQHRVGREPAARPTLRPCSPPRSARSATSTSRSASRLRAARHPSPGRLAVAQVSRRVAVLGRLQRPQHHRAARTDRSSPPLRVTLGQQAHPRPDHVGVGVTVRALNAQTEALAASISDQLKSPPPRATSLPRSGSLRAARLLAEIGGVRGPFPTPDALACLASVPLDPSPKDQGRHLPLGSR
jgi:hypothetical protein